LESERERERERERDTERAPASVMGQVVLGVWLVGMFTGDLKNACHYASVE
jgi:hypothetical protein